MCVCVRTRVLCAPGFLFLFIRRSNCLPRKRDPRVGLDLAVGERLIVSAQVGEWLKPTDCKSVPPSEVRRFESFPVHQE
jgi:hypothetical protein